MFNDDFWSYLAIGGLGLGAYFMGKQKGINVTVQEYSVMQELADQRKLIADLSAKLERAENKNWKDPQMDRDFPIISSS